ncbi:hypothetical protein ABT115_04505 [Streptomyces sp. NPDC001832]|uniref:hypothetical protein n=1 Tax=Streptomyces sp. NPDC001832 TaxID=3154527 RepID=UPI003324B092
MKRSRMTLLSAVALLASLAPLMPLTASRASATETPATQASASPAVVAVSDPGFQARTEVIDKVTYTSVRTRVAPGRTVTVEVR